MNIKFRVIQKPAQEPMFRHERLYETPYTGTKYAEVVVLTSKSVIQNQEGSAVYAGLALGRVGALVPTRTLGQLIRAWDRSGWRSLVNATSDSDLAIQCFSSP
jgi:hypothetical protein